LKKSTWENHKDEKFYGEEYLSTCGFIHCSDIDTFCKVAPNFKDINEPLVLLCIDTALVQPEIKWEDLEDCGTRFPHIYGLLNIDSVVEIMPFLKDVSDGFDKMDLPL